MGLLVIFLQTVSPVDTSEVNNDVTIVTSGVVVGFFLSIVHSCPNRELVSTTATMRFFTFETHDTIKSYYKVCENLKTEFRTTGKLQNRNYKT